MVRLEPPELTSATGSVTLLPTGTLPKARLAGLAFSAQSFTPVPRTARLRVGLEALLVNTIVPGMLPAALGVSVTFTPTLWPTANVKGGLKLLTVYADALIPTAVT